MDYVAVDLGASSTRYTSIDGKVNFIPNNVFFVDNMSTELNNAKDGEIHENNLDVSIWKDGESEFFPMRALVGAMATRVNSFNLRPGQQQHKYEQRINYLSTVLAIALSRLKNPALGDKVNLFSTLPPYEVSKFKDKFKQNLVGKYTVNFNKIGPNNGTTLQFEINEVYCYEESRMAIVQFLFDSNYPDRIAKFGTSKILSIDIGASTTDLAVFDGVNFLERTGRTYKVGGNTVRDLVSEEATAVLGNELSLTEAEQCLNEGRIKFGNSYKPFGDKVEECKKLVAQDIVSKMDSYFNKIGLSLNSINYIIVSGGGSMESSYIDDEGKKVVTSKPMSEYITLALKNICDGVEVLHFGDEPRTANIRGLGMFAAVCNGVVTG